ncbi:hypothetical protein ILUMI_19566, partial [Ignelater luminosus]
IVDKLMLCSTDIKTQHKEINTPLHQALLKCRELEIINSLLSKGADVSIQNLKGESPLHYAIRPPAVDYHPVCLDRHYELVFERRKNEFLCSSQQILRYLDTLLPKAADVNIKDVDGQTPLHLGVKYGDYAIVDRIISYKAALNAQNNAGNTPLHLALLEKRLGCESPLHFAIRPPAVDYHPLRLGRNYELDLKRKKERILYSSKTIPEYLDALLPKAADVNTKDVDGQTPLHLGVKYGDYAIVDRIISYKAAINAQDNAGNTSLHLALSEHKGWDVIKLLLMKGANVNLKNEDGETPLHFAIRYGNYVIGHLILNHNVDINVPINKGDTPLHLAASIPHNLKTISLLVSGGADENVKNSNDETPLQIKVSVRNNYDTVSEFFP